MIEYLLLGVLQGLTEWLPISSQGQTVLVSKALGLPVDSLNLSIWLHTGTLFAAIVYFRRDLVQLLKLERNDLLKFLVLSTVVTAIIGAPLYLGFEGSLANMPGQVVMGAIGLLLIVTGLVQKYAKPKGRDEASATKKDAILVGLAQGFSVLPGISRTGMTTSSLLFLGFKSKAALRLSYLMSIFAVAAAEIGLQIRGEFEIGIGPIIAVVAAFFVGILTIDLLLKLAQKIKFWKFCIILGVVSLVPLIIYFL
jgi:undecaprenyl-diphosphatase